MNEFQKRHTGEEVKRGYEEGMAEIRRELEEDDGSMSATQRKIYERMLRNGWKS